jgi:hypothetical protein
MGVAALSRYSPLIVFLVGLSTFLGCLGTGLLIQRLFRWKLPTPWKQVTALCIGVELLCLSVEAVGMGGVAYPRVLLCIAVGIVALGAIGLWMDRAALRAAATHHSKPGAAILLLPLSAIAILLVIALAPSTKNDEIYYHMVIPARLIADHALHFYRQPWEGAITPQMGYQIGTAPLYALGYPDGSNPLGLCIAVLIAWFTYQIVNRRSGHPTWAVAAATVPLVGMAATTLYTAAGPHALGDLGCVALFVAILDLESLMTAIGPLALIAMLSILGAAGAMTKLPFVPVTLLAVAYGTVKIMRGRPQPFSTPAAVLIALIPWLLLFVPLLCWTYATSGSPFGPLLTGLFPASVYDRSLIGRFLAESRAYNRLSLREVFLTLVLHLSPALWMGVALFFTTLATTPTVRRRGGILLIGQTILVALLLPQSVRFLAAIPLALFITASAALLPGHRYARCVRLATILAILPGLAISAFYARQFLPALRGGASLAHFIAEKIPLIADYQALDALLPPDAVLLLRDETRIDGYYCPRLLVLDPADAPSGRPLYQIQLQGPGIGPPRFELKNYRTAEVIYHNPMARVQAFRTPGRRPLTGDLQLIHLSKIKNQAAISR